MRRINVFAIAVLVIKLYPMPTTKAGELGYGADVPDELLFSSPHEALAAKRSIKTHPRKPLPPYRTARHPIPPHPQPNPARHPIAAEPRILTVGDVGDPTIPNSKNCRSPLPVTHILKRQGWFDMTSLDVAQEFVNLAARRRDGQLRRLRIHICTGRIVAIQPYD